MAILKQTETKRRAAKATFQARSIPAQSKMMFMCHNGSLNLSLVHFSSLTPVCHSCSCRRCALSLQTLHNCRTANASNPSICNNLETQVVYSHAEVLCPELAAANQRCFRRVVNSKGELPPSTCDKDIEAMKKCLIKYGVYPFK